MSLTGSEVIRISRAGLGVCSVHFHARRSFTGSLSDFSWGEILAPTGLLSDVERGLISGCREKVADVVSVKVE